MRIIFGLIVSLLIFSTGCGKDENQRDVDEQIIKEYIDENNLDAISSGSGLYYVINNPGDDQHPTLNSTVNVIYTGKFTNGGQFDSSNGNTVSFPLQNLIQGWQEGIPIFGKGGDGILLVPSHLGYGSSSRGSIPPNSVLVFDMKLVSFN